METGSLAAVIAAVGIWAGIAAMLVANHVRSRQQAEALKQQRETDEHRHAEAMQAHAGNRRALEALIAGLERQGAALDRQGAALEELIRRAPAQPAE